MPGLLRVVAELEAPVRMDGAIHLDALLVAIWYRRHPQCSTRPGRGRPLDDRRKWLTVGLGVIGDACYAASAWMPSSRGEPHHFTKRRDPGDVERLARPYTPGSGPGRDTMERHLVYPEREAEWWAWGRRRAVLTALRCVHAIGGGRRSGLGVVRRWRVEAESGLARLAVVQDGRATRALPARLCVAPETALAHCRPPYWHADTVEPAVRPGEPARLRDGLEVRCY